MMLAFYFIAMTTVAGTPVTNITGDTLQRGQQQILARMGHVMVWKFPEGPMTLGCLIMAAGVALGICIMCVWSHFQWSEMTNGAVNAVRNALRRDSRTAGMFVTGVPSNMVLTPTDDASMIVHEASFDAPPAYEDIAV